MSNLLDLPDRSIFQAIPDIYNIGVRLSNFTLRHPKMISFLNSEQDFDVIILEIFLTESLLGIGHKFKAPVIGISTFGSSKWTNDLVGSPSPSSYVPHPFLK